MTRPAERERPRRPIPSARFATAWAALVYAGATMTLAWPALLGQFLVTIRSDQYIAGYAFREFAASWIRDGRGVPLWNPYLFGGMPYVAAMHGDIFYPTALLRLVLPTDVAMTWGMIVHVFLAGLFTFVFLRAVGLGFFGALVGGLAYMLGGNVAGLVSPGHDGKLFVSALLPLALLVVHRGIRDGLAWAWGALALTITLVVLTPHPQLLQYLLLACGVYSLFLAFGRTETGKPMPRTTAFRRLGLATIAVGIGLLGGAIQFLPLMEYTAWSPRAGGTDWTHATSYSLPPEEIFNFYLPQFSGILSQYWGRNVIHHHSEYIGASVLVLAGLAFGRSSPGTRRLVWFWAGVLVVALLWALGGYTPFYRIVYAIVPGTKFFRAPSTMLYIVSFCVAVLAATGLDRVLTKRQVSLRYVAAWLGAGLVIAALATTGALTNVASTIAIPQLLDRVDQGRVALTLGAWRSLLIVGAVSAVVFVMARGKLSATATGWSLAALITLDLWSVERHYWGFSPPASMLFKSDPVIDYLKRMPQPARVLPYALQPVASIPQPDPFMRYGDGKATGLMVHRIRNVAGYHGNELGRYRLLTGWDVEEGWVQRFANPNLRRLTNTRYWYTNVAEPPLPDMRLVAGPATNAAGNIVYLYEFAEDNPLAWIAPLAIEAPDENVLATVLDPRFDVRRAALFDTAAAVPVQPVPTTLPPPADVRVTATRYEPGHISLTLDRPAPRGSALVVSENYYPGWTVTVDGRRAPIGRAQYVLIGVALPEGARSVELSFQSSTYERGKAITLVALALGVLMLAGGFVLSRRRRG